MQLNLARVLAVAAVSALVVACGHASVPPPPATPNALTWSGCGPTDGPAQTIVISDAPLACGKVSEAQTRIELELWSGAPLSDVPLALRGNTGAARACKSGGACTPIDDASVVFHGDADGTTVGSLSYTDGGVTVTRSFRATTCRMERQVCG